MILIMHQSRTLWQPFSCPEIKPWKFSVTSVPCFTAEAMMSIWAGNFAAIVTKTCHCSAERGNDIQISISEFSQSKVFEHENSISHSLCLSLFQINFTLSPIYFLYQSEIYFYRFFENNPYPPLHFLLSLSLSFCLSLPQIVFLNFIWKMSNFKSKTSNSFFTTTTLNYYCYNYSYSFGHLLYI